MKNLKKVNIKHIIHKSSFVFFIEDFSARQSEQLSEVVKGPEGPVRSPLPVSLDNTPRSAGSPPSILPPKLPEKELKPLPSGAPGHTGDVWSPWLGTCQVISRNIYETCLK